MSDPLNPPLLTSDHPGTGGRIKVELEDFDVEEIPAYEPSGEGEHLYLWIEKRDLGAEYFARQLALRLGIAAGEVGMAGMKDRRAVTRQWVSVPALAESRLSQLDGDGIRVLKVSRHSNKLRPGHLRGNRFRILIREVPANAGETVQPILDRIRVDGLPNFYGPQRFGHDGETARLGMEMLRGENKGIRSGFLRKLALSAAQSVLFNDCLARRIQDGMFRTVLEGDVMAKWPAGGMFVARDLADEQRRFDAREVVHTGPMFGRKMFPAGGAADQREAVVLSEAGLCAESFAGFGKLLQGTRRHNVVYVDDLHCESEADGLRLSFSLPAGSYATMLIREITKLPGGD